MRQGEPGLPSQLDQDDVDGEDDGDGDDVDNEGEVGNYFLLFSAEAMPDNKVASLRGTSALSVGAVDKQNYILIILVMVMMVRITNNHSSDLGLEKGMKKRQILLGQKVNPVKIQNKSQNHKNRL